MNLVQSYKEYFVPYSLKLYFQNVGFLVAFSKKDAPYNVCFRSQKCSLSSDDASKYLMQLPWLHKYQPYPVTCKPHYVFDKEKTVSESSKICVH